MFNLQSEVTKAETQAVSVLAKNWYWVAAGCLIVGFILGTIVRLL